jgi:ethanolaminephosphotransferase
MLSLDLITLIGLLWSLFALACTLLVNPNLNTTEHRYLHLITALCVLLYQLFDNMDGKQARRIGASSPLGMLFDHGCDAINSTVISIPVAAALGTGWTPKLFFCLWCGYVPFYVQTWEEYYVGAMVLPVINGKMHYYTSYCMHTHSNDSVLPRAFGRTRHRRRNVFPVLHVRSRLVA